MTQAEMLAWVEFYKQHPFDDYARLYRPAALVAACQNGADINELLSWLEPKQSNFSGADMATLKALGMKPPGG